MTAYPSMLFNAFQSFSIPFNSVRGREVIDRRIPHLLTAFANTVGHRHEDEKKMKHQQERSPRWQS